MQKKSRVVVSLAALLVLAAGAPGQAADAPAGTREGTEVFSTDLPDLGNVGGTAVKSSAYGSALAVKPGTTDTFYGLTDRGPNVDGPKGVKIEPFPDYAPQIGEFRMVDGKAKLQRVVELRGTDGKPYNGRVSTEASTGETITDLNGKNLPASDHGYDSEGLVALPDGTFWVSEEYGPYITHFDVSGRQIGRLSPFDGTLPGELKQRDPNKGMEGLTVTPDGKTLVGMMQSALVTPDLKGKPKNVVPVRIVTVDLATGTSHQYLYLRHLDSADTNISEITALNDHEFLVDERDGSMGKDSFKRFYRIDLRGATDVSRSSTVAETSYDAARGGLLVDGKSIEGLVGTAKESDAAAVLDRAGITAAGSTLYLDVTKLVWGIDQTGGWFAHDKIEGVASPDSGRNLWLSNDSDYGLDGSTGQKAPFGLKPKILPDGTQDDGQFLHVDMSAVAADATGPGYVPTPSASTPPAPSTTETPVPTASEPTAPTPTDSASTAASSPTASGAPAPAASATTSAAPAGNTPVPSASASSAPVPAGPSSAEDSGAAPASAPASGNAASSTSASSPAPASAPGSAQTAVGTGHPEENGSTPQGGTGNAGSSSGTGTGQQPPAGGLASTGARNAGILSLAGGVVLAVGLGMVAVSRRRRRS